jgi:membrane-associated phospholipid phosphatase
MIEYVKMPQPLLVIGLFYGVVAAFYLVRFIRDGYWHGMAGQLKINFTSHPKRILISLIILAITILFIDMPIAKFAQDYYNHDFYKCVDFINAMGEGWFIGGVIFTFFLLFQFLSHERMAIVAKISFMASIYAGLFNAVIKFVFNRERPGIGMNPWHFFHFWVTGAKHVDDLFYAYNSMPSGHTVTIFAAITPFLLSVKTKWVKITLLLCALIMCFARIYTLNHWLSDVYIAALFGLIIGYSSYECNKHRLLGLK